MDGASEDTTLRLAGLPEDRRPSSPAGAPQVAGKGGRCGCSDGEGDSRVAAARSVAG